MDEQLRILKMIEEGTITAEQGAELMSAMNTDPAFTDRSADLNHIDIFQMDAKRPHNELLETLGVCPEK